MATIIPSELDPMAALENMVAQQAQQPRAASPASAAREDLPVAQPLKPDNEYSGPQRKDGATVPTHDPLFSSPAPQPKETQGASIPSPIPEGDGLFTGARVTAASAAPPVDSVVASNRLLFTGRSGAGKKYLAKLVGASVVNLDSPILGLVKKYYPEGKPENFGPFIATIRAWGDGVVNKDFPMTPTRFLFERFMGRDDGGVEGFGQPGFWIRYMLSTIENAGALVAITNITTAAEYSALKAAGFTHFHVMCSAQTYASRPKRQGANDSLAAALDQDAIKKISGQRQGPQLPVVWSDQVVPPPSPRLWSAMNWVRSLTTGNEQAASVAGVSLE